MAVNLIRNSRVFFTTNVDSAGNVRLGYTPSGIKLSDSSNGFTTSNTFEIQVLEGLTFTQNTTSDTVTLSETGDAPNRGQRSFNTALEPVDFSFSTYVRPYKKSGGSGGAYPSGGLVTCEERFLWNAFASSTAIPSVSGGVVGTQGSTAWYESTSAAEFILAASNKNQLQAFGLIIAFSDQVYVIDNCAMDTATVDFGIDQIAAIQWAGKGTLIRAISNLVVDAASAGEIAFSNREILASAMVPGRSYAIANLGATLAADWTAAGADASPAVNELFVHNTTAITGDATAKVREVVVHEAAGASTNKSMAKNVDGRYITNKLSVLALDDTIAGTTDDYKFAITGGSITLANNITYITPANLGQVNIPITYYTGTRSVTGTFNAYLKSGTAASSKTSGQLLEDLLASSSTDVEPSFAIEFDMGGTSGTYVKFYVPAAVLQIPTVNTEQVISTTINFTAQGYNTTTNTFDIEKDNELKVTYNCVAV